MVKQPPQLRARFAKPLCRCLAGVQRVPRHQQRCASQLRCQVDEPEMVIARGQQALGITASQCSVGQGGETLVPIFPVLLRVVETNGRLALVSLPKGEFLA